MPSETALKNHDIPTRYRDPNLLIVFGVTLMAVLGVSSITPAFPRIGRELSLPSQAVGNLITAFTLPGVLLTPILGILADRWSRKRILFPSLMVFGLAGSACSLVRDFEILLVLRFVQGIGAASLSVLYTTLIGDLYRGQARTAAMGCNASVLSVGTAGYPLIGGALATLGWAYPFVLPILAVPIGFLVLFALENPEPKSEQGLGRYLQQAWGSIRHRQAVGLFALTLMAFAIIYGAYLTYLPFLMEYTFQASPLVIGIAMSGMSLATALTSSQLGRLARSWSQKTLLQASCGFYATALVMIPLTSRLWVLGIALILFGVAQGLSIPNLQTLLAGLAPIEHRGAFMSVNGMILRLGQTVGPPLMGTVFSVWGIDSTFYAAAAVAGAMFVLTAVIIKKRRRSDGG
ncbi:MAG: MFS transporter [Anaerolineae bacterium]|jgi:predicted MFS family arabinose efflux permease